MTVMDKAGNTGFIHNYLCRHTTQLKEIYFLPEKFQDAGFWIGQTDERKIVITPISLKGIGIFRTDDDNLGVAINKFRIIKTQLRQMRAAERSGKTAVKYQQDIGSAFEI